MKLCTIYFVGSLIATAALVQEYRILHLWKTGIKRMRFLNTSSRIHCCHLSFFCSLAQNTMECFHCHAIKNKVWNRSMKEAKKMKCSKRLIHKQYFQVSSLCGSSFLSYLPKRVTRFYRALYGDAMLVFLRRTSIWRPEINKNSWLELNFRWKRFLFARELNYMSLIMSSNASNG